MTKKKTTTKKPSGKKTPAKRKNDMEDLNERAARYWKNKKDRPSIIF